MTNVIDTFGQRRIQQIPPIGAVMITRGYGVSTVRFNDRMYTRVQNMSTGNMIHLKGDVETDEAVKLARKLFF